jgi:GNAT superfamily N-acetyltransferase
MNLAAAAALSASAGWNQTVEDWSMLLKLAPATCFALDFAGQLRATATLVCYGDRLAWLGMVLTQPQYRRRGFARRLLEHALTAADERKVRTVKLDATEHGLPLYEQMGFRVEQTIQRWARKGPGGTQPSNRSGDGLTAQLPDIDSEAFGADRTSLLRMLALRSAPLCSPHGFLFRRAGLKAAYVGPCVAATESVARELLGTILQSSATWYWDILTANRSAERLAAEAGFKVERTLMRMARGEKQTPDDSKIYAIAGFELG